MMLMFLAFQFADLKTVRDQFDYPGDLNRTLIYSGGTVLEDRPDSRESKLSPDLLKTIDYCVLEIYYFLHKEFPLGDYTLPAHTLSVKVPIKSGMNYRSSNSDRVGFVIGLDRTRTVLDSTLQIFPKQIRCEITTQPNQTPLIAGAIIKQAFGPSLTLYSMSGK